MLVSSLISRSKSLSLRFAMILDGSVGDFNARELLEEGALEVIAGELALAEAAVEPARLVGCRVVAVRLVGSPEAGRCGPAIADYTIRSRIG